jgi:hypothetical protein
MRCTWLLVVVVLGLPPALAWRAHVPWDIRDWCDRVRAPLWPFAYRKSDLTLETKGRSVSSAQDLRHMCQTRGARSVCNRCEDFTCNLGITDREVTCNMQIQGIDWLRLPPNVPTVTDTPFAVGPNVTHRNDFANADRVCLMLQGGACLLHDTVTFGNCAMRCWGTSYAPPTPFQFGWTYPKSQGLPQGKVFTLAGAGTPGFRDGVGAAAQFNKPQGVAVDLARNVYVADTGNHCIRRVLPDGTTTTFAGSCGTAGLRDGPLLYSLFSSPTGVALYHNASEGNRLTLFVADAGNHRIRRIREEPGAGGPFEVSIWAGGRTMHPEATVSQAGLEDGLRTQAGFNNPRGIAVDNASNIFVADTDNHVIRWIDPTGYVRVIAGTVVSARNGTLPGGCPEPCLRGVQGYNDGPRNASGFSFPVAVAISEDGTVRVCVAGVGCALCPRVRVYTHAWLSVSRGVPMLLLRVLTRVPARPAANPTRPPPQGRPLTLLVRPLPPSPFPLPPPHNPPRRCSWWTPTVCAASPAATKTSAPFRTSPPSTAL